MHDRPKLTARYCHTNLVARDWRRLAGFYERVFGCVPVPPERDLKEEWLARASGVPGARLRGIHLRLPGGGPQGPTLEVFQYDSTSQSEGGRGAAAPPTADRPGFGHIAFEVEDVEAALAAVVAGGGAPLGEIVSVPIEGAGTITFTYARDPEGNILELQRWCASS
ncbi:MAG: VOC family protein [Spirochaetales bacterium]|nr:VOC family protein [Spirochaetales bacterium]